MTTTMPARSSSRTSGGYVDRPQSSSLADVLDIILDKGIVIDAYVRVSLVGIELLTIDARIVIASVDTYLRFAEATSRLNLGNAQGEDLPELMQDVTQGATQSGAKGKAKGALDAAGEKINEAVGRGDRDDEQQHEGSSRRQGDSG